MCLERIFRDVLSADQIHELSAIQRVLFHDSLCVYELRILNLVLLNFTVKKRAVSNRQLHASFLPVASSLPSVANSASAPVIDGCPNDVPQISCKFSRFRTEIRIQLRVNGSRIAAHFRIAQFPHWNTSFPKIPDLRLFRVVNPRIAAQRKHYFAVIDSDLHMGHRPTDRTGERDCRNQQTDRRRERESFHRVPPFLEALGHRDTHEGRSIVIRNDLSVGLRVKKGGSIAGTEPP